MLCLNATKGRDRANVLMGRPLAAYMCGAEKHHTVSLEHIKWYAADRASGYTAACGNGGGGTIFPLTSANRTTSPWLRAANALGCDLILWHTCAGARMPGVCSMGTRLSRSCGLLFYRGIFRHPSGARTARARFAYARCSPFGQPSVAAGAAAVFIGGLQRAPRVAPLSIVSPMLV